MAAKKKKSKAKGESPNDDAIEQTVHVAVQPPAVESHAPILAKPRKKNRNVSSESDSWTLISNAEPTFGEEVKKLTPSCDKGLHGADGGESHPPVLSKARKQNKFHNDSPVDLEEKFDELPLVSAGNSNNGSGQVETTNTPVDTVEPGEARKENGNRGAVKGHSKPTEWFNPARKEALEAVSDFKIRILERAAKQALLNDTRFTPSPYPDDLCLYDKPSNTPEDTAMLKLKQGFDAAIMERDPSLTPEKDSIPLNIAKRAAMYVCGLLRAHDGQFRCAIDGLRDPPGKGQEPQAPWGADTWEERLLDSDRDWLLGKKVEEMEDEKARMHVGDVMEFIFKYKVWGQMVEDECAEMGVEVFPRLN
ncbi:hypothetical protein Slin15195_G069750 [Septoria linicola]|uniref:Uncharacterized protein n=1 Tax=Septoria linicola TaxID=215465 RepID=A0A9Q9EJC5_9PEZI|nr:hypothetical protein Slin15195_G069750 [Septoria linicola]